MFLQRPQVLILSAEVYSGVEACFSVGSGPYALASGAQRTFMHVEIYATCTLSYDFRNKYYTLELNEN